MTDSDAIFDDMSSSYDSGFTHTGLGQYYRERVQLYMKQHWRGDKNIVEINAGTGEDAIYLAQLGNNILVTDQSAKMLNVASDKLKKHLCLARVEFQQLDIENLGQLPEQKYDGLLSNFGGLNCVEDLQNFTQSLASIIKPKGIVILCIMGPYVPWEWAWFSLRGQFRKAFRRVLGKAQWQGTSIYYPPPHKIKRLMHKSSFECIGREALGILMPPTYARKTVENWPKTFGFLGRVEKKISKSTAATYLADHYVLVFEKSSEVQENE